MHQMYVTQLLFISLLALLQPNLISNTWADTNDKLPNIIFMFADDLGYADLSCYGHPYAQTPNLDQMAKEGTRFTQFYVAGVTCSPSRTGFMTGRHSARYKRYPGHFGFGDRITITDLLKKKGYKTGHFGKWHIGPVTENVYGIDVYDAAPGKSHPGGRDYTLYDAAINFIKENADQPFYVNIWGHITHFPVNAPNELVEKIKDLKVNRDDFSKSMQRKFDESMELKGDIDAAMREYMAEVTSLDTSIGRVLKTIDELGIRDNTIVIFSSDHGPAPIKLGGPKGTREFSQNMLGYAGIHRGAKHNQYEGGVRVPFIIRWPGKVKADRVDHDSVLSGLDWLPTLCKLTGITDIPDGVDGEDVSLAWLGKERIRETPLFWRTSSEKANPSMRFGHWKLHLKSAKGKDLEPELYDLSKDPAESNNIARSNPEVVERLTRMTRAWIAELPETYEKSEKKQSKKKDKKGKAPKKKKA